MFDVSKLTPEERAQLEAQLAALDAGTNQHLDATAQAAGAPAPNASVAPGPLSTPSDPPPPTDTAPSPPAQPGDATAAQTTGYRGPKVGETVSHTFVDAYADDTEVTRYGVVVGTHAADPDVAGSVNRAEIAWLPEGTAVLDVDDLDSL